MAIVLDGGLNKITGVPGTLMQVVQGSNSTYQLTNSSTPVTTNLSVTITPTSTTSKVLIMIHGAGAGTNGATVGAEYSIYKNGSSLFVFDRLNHYAANYSYGPVTACYLDSPATLSATTYTLYYRVYSGSGNCYLNNYASGAFSQSTITAMEIAG